jgi:hypothetical protein
MHLPELDDAARARLGEVAWGAAFEAARGGRLRLELDREAPRLREPGAAFVTLESERGLRGCIGALEPRLPLAEQVVLSAHQAAVADPRFPPVSASELEALTLKVSALGPPERLAVESREALLAVLVPGRDGLILACGVSRATFLPGVWATLPTPEAFVRALERKAGFAVDAWVRGVICSRYRTQEWDAPRSAGLRHLRTHL